MQALNVQILEPQNAKIQSNKISSGRNSMGRGPSFKDMVKSMSKKESLASLEKNAPKNQPVNENDRHVENIEKAENVSSEVSGKSVKNTAEDNQVKEEVASASKKEISNEVPQTQGRFAEYVPVAAENFIPASRIEKSDYDIPAFEELSIGDSELTYLKTKATSNDDPLALIENASDYTGTDDLFANAQNLSVEDPVKFLDRLEVAGENSLASDVDVAAIETFAETSIAVAPVQNKDSDGTMFSLEVADSDSEVKTEATSLFNEIFTVNDNRSVEEKVAQFKSMINEQAENNSDNNINLALTLNENAAQNILASNDQSAGAAGSTFQEMLTQQVQVNVPDFVKAGNIVLRDNNQGSINMILKPESLGNVKINLQVTDNVITGQITVHSKEAFEAFKQNMDNLRQAFQDSGFDNASLNLSFADNSSSGAFAQGERQQSSEQFFGNQSYRSYAAGADSDDYAVSENASYDAGVESQVSIVA